MHFVSTIIKIGIKRLDVVLQYYVDGPEEDVVDYGTVGTAENRTKLLRIVNGNPVEVRENSTCFSL